MPSPVLRLVSGSTTVPAVRRQAVDDDTVTCLRALLADAEAGKIVGITYAALSKDHQFFFSSCGEAQRSPAWATAMSVTLHHGNVRRVFGEDE